VDKIDITSGQKNISADDFIHIHGGENAREPHESCQKEVLALATHFAQK